MKKHLFAGILLFLTLSVSAQGGREKNFFFSIGGEAGQLSRKGRNYTGTRFGVSLQQEFLIQKVGITLNLGYFQPNDYYFVEKQLWLMAGARYYFTKNIFVAGQLGPSLVVGNDWAGLGITYAPGIGVKFKSVDISLHYRAVTSDDETLGVVGLRLGIGF